MSTLEKLKQLDKERLTLIEDAKKHMLGEINAHLKDLAELGCHYELIERTAPKRRRRRKKTTE